MSYENARKFKELLESDEELRAKLQEAAVSFTGNRDDDRDVFEQVVAPFARSAGIERIRANGTDAEIEVFDGLPHGFGLGTGTAAEGWFDRAVDFWERQLM